MNYLISLLKIQLCIVGEVLKCAMYHLAPKMSSRGHAVHWYGDGYSLDLELVAGEGVMPLEFGSQTKVKVSKRFRFQIPGTSHPRPRANSKTKESIIVFIWMDSNSIYIRRGHVNSPRGAKWGWRISELNRGYMWLCAKMRNTNCKL